MDLSISDGYDGRGMMDYPDQGLFNGNAAEYMLQGYKPMDGAPRRVPFGQPPDK